MRVIERNGRTAAVAEPAPEAPGWWAEYFGRRQARLRKRILARLRIAEHATPTLYYSLAQFERPEIDHALRSMAGEGIIVAERRTEPRRHKGGPDDVCEWAYWSL